MTGRSQDVPDLDVTTPNVARIYDYFLGGKDNFAADRAAAEKMLDIFPTTPAAAKTNRAFLQRAVRHLASEYGIRQFLDIGTGLPTQGNVHEVAQSVAPDARVVYVDYDPVVVLHAEALLSRAGTVAVVRADLRDPEAVLRHAEKTGLIDFSQPVAVLLVAILHFIADTEDPYRIVARLRDALAPGSHLAVSHLTMDDATAEQIQRSHSVYANASAPITPRSHGDILRFFDGFDLLDPGLVWVSCWTPTPSDGLRPIGKSHCYAGVGGIRSPRGR